MKKGFTLVELLIVIAIIAILAAIAIPQYTKYVKKAAAANAQATLSACLNQAMAEFADEGKTSYTCTVDLGGGNSDNVTIGLDNNGTLSWLSYNGTNSTDNGTKIEIEIKGHKVKCYPNKNTNTITCEPA